jgi:citrate lyase subunit beta/citryl-CoA lyase
MAEQPDSADTRADGSVSHAAMLPPRGPSGHDWLVRRSELTCPGHSLTMMAKAAASSADQVVFDLEDACAVSQKVAARQTVIQALTTLDFGAKLRTFRPNNIRTRFFYRDLIEVVEAAGGRLDAVIVPKVYGHEDVLFVDRLLAQIEENMGFPVGQITLEVLIESADAVLHAEAIAKCTPRMGGLIFGLVDYAGDIGAQELGDEQFFYYNYAKAKTIAAARAAGITCVDGVTLALRDLDACRRDARMAARMGFDGKWAIHPAQVDIINEAFTPTPEEIARAARIIAAYERADVAEGRGAIVLDDQMIDAAQLRIEQKRLAIARRAGRTPNAPEPRAP